MPELELKGAVFGKDVERRPALYHTDIECGERDIEPFVSAAGRGGLALQPVYVSDQLAHIFDCIDTVRTERGVCLEPAHTATETLFALMCDDRCHFSWLADDAHSWPLAVCSQCINNLRNTDAAYFLIKSKAVMDGNLEVAAQKFRGKGKHDRNEALHIADAAAEQLAIVLGQLPGINCPALPVHRDHVGMTNEQDSGSVHGPNDCVQARLIFIFTEKEPALDAEIPQISVGKVNQGQIGITAHRWDFDELPDHLQAS